MAEILISLTVIGVIAAIIIPSIHANMEQKSWATKKKALYNRLSQAIDMLPKLTGYGTYSGSYSEGSVSVTEDTAAMAFVTEGLQTVLKLKNICDNENFEQCGISSKIINLVGSSRNFPTKLSEFNPYFSVSYSNFDGSSPGNSPVDTKMAAFETVNGDSVAVFYNPYCQPDTKTQAAYGAQDKMCVNFIFDINGKKRPNKIGEDMGFITVMYSYLPKILMPVPLKTRLGGEFTYTNAVQACINKGKDIKLPDKDEFSVLFYNQDLVGITTGGGYWTSTLSNSNRGWQHGMGGGVNLRPLNYPVYAYCIKK